MGYSGDRPALRRHLSTLPMLWLAALICFGAQPKAAFALDLDAQRALVNEGVIGVLGDDVYGTDFTMIAELAAILDQGYERRILPMAGAGSVRAIEDLLLLRGVDLAFIQTDVLDFYKKADLFPNIDNRIRYLAKLYDKEFHLLASKDIESIEDLEGKRVNFGPAASGSFLTASLVFTALGISVEISDDGFQIALDRLRQGEIDAWVRVDAKPSLQIEKIASDDGLHLLPLPAAAIGDAYAAASLTAADYPGLIEDGSEVATLTVPTVMAVYAWPKRAVKSRQLRRFYGGLSDGIARLRQPPFHAKWREVDLNAQIPGWQRF